MQLPHASFPDDLDEEKDTDDVDDDALLDNDDEFDEDDDDFDDEEDVEFDIHDDVDEF